MYKKYGINGTSY